MTMTATNSRGYATTAGITADPVVFTTIENKLHVLLIQRNTNPYENHYALPGGFIDYGQNPETPEQTVARKLTEKTGLKNIYLEQLGTYGNIGRDPRGHIISIAYLALIPETPLEHGHWHKVDDLPNLAFDHKQIISDGIERIRGKLWYSNIAVGLLPKTFTLNQAHKVYTAISGEEYDLSNFRRDIRASKLIEETGDVHTGKGRPASLWRYVSTKPEWSPSRKKM